MPGPKPDMAMDEEVKRLRAKGLTFREIAKILGKDVTTIFYRWKRVSRLAIKTGDKKD